MLKETYSLQEETYHLLHQYLIQLRKMRNLSSTVDEREQEEVKATVKWPLFKGGKTFLQSKKQNLKLEEKQLILMIFLSSANRHC